MDFRLDIQGLRALAVIAVIIFHLDSSFLPGGFLGVDIFFVISGYLISKSIINQIDSGSFNLIKFFIGRFKRIVPAYFVMLFVCILLAIFYFPQNDFSTFYSQAKAALIFVSNLIFGLGTNYFGAQNHEYLLLHTWSLAIEMQFYFVLPLLLLFIPKPWRKLAFITLFFILLAYTEYNLRILDNKSSMYFSLPARSLEFIIGIAVNFLPNSSKLKLSTKNLMGIGFFASIIASLFFINENSVFPGLLSLPACIGTAGIIWLEKGWLNKFFSKKILVFIGKISYSLYLWHWPVLAFYRYRTGEYTIQTLDVIFLTVVFSALSLASFYVVEEPIRKLKGKRLFIYGFSLMAITGIVWITSGLLNSKAVEIPDIYIKHIRSENHNKFTSYQLIGDTSVPDKKILLIGDSHALSMMPFFEQVGKKYGLNFSYLTSDSFLPFPGFHNYEFTDQKSKDLQKELSVIGDSLIKGSRIIIVVRQWHRQYDFRDQIAYFQNTIKKEQDLIFLTDYPNLEQDPARKYLSYIKPSNFKKEKLKEPIIDQDLLRAIESQSNFHLINMQDDDFFKDSPFYNDTLMFYDKRHINEYGSRKFANHKGEIVSEVLFKFLKESKE